MFKKLRNKSLGSEFIKKILLGSLWLTIGSVVSRIFMALGFIFLARELDPDNYGKFGILKSTIDSFLIFATAGLGITATKFIAEFKDKKELLSSILGIIFLSASFSGLMVTVAVIFFADEIAENFLKAPDLTFGLKVCAITLFFASYNAIQLGAFLGFEDYKGQMRVSIIQGLSIGILISVGGFFFGFNGAIFGMLFAMITTVFYSSLTLRKILLKHSIFLSLKNWRKEAKNVARFCIPVVLSSVITSPILWLMNSMLARTSSGFQELGVYNAVYIFPSLILLLNSMIGNALLPIILRMSSSLSIQQERFNYLINWIISIFLVLFLSSFPEIVSLILGDKYSVDTIYKILIFSLASSLLISHRQGIARNLVKKNKMLLSVFSMGQWSLTSVIIFYYFRDEGALGLAVSIFIGYAINTLIFVPFFIKKGLAPKNIFYEKWVNVLGILSFLFLFLNNINLTFQTRTVIFVIELTLITYVVLRTFTYDIGKNHLENQGI